MDTPPASASSPTPPPGGPPAPLPQPGSPQGASLPLSEPDFVRAIPALPPQPIEPPPTPIVRESKAVYIDLEGTLARISLIGTLLWMKKCELGGLYRVWQLGLLVKAPYWLLLRALRSPRYSRSVHYEYAGMNRYEAAEWAESCYRGYIKPRVFPAAMKRLRELRGQGYRLVLVSDGLDFLAAPLARELRADVIAPQLVDLDSEFTGAMSTTALQGEQRANALRAHAEEHGIDLARSQAYANSFTDLPMLECVGQPVAVRPGRALAAAARRREWPIENWRGG